MVPARADFSGRIGRTDSDQRCPRVRQAKSAKDAGSAECRANAAHRLPRNEPAGRRRAWDDSVFALWEQDGKKEGAVYYARVGRFEAQAKLPFERPPVTANGSRIALSRADKPMPGATVALDAPDRLKIELPSDAAGMIETGIAYADASISGSDAAFRQAASRQPLTIKIVPSIVAVVRASSKNNHPAMAAQMNTVYSTGSSTCASARA